MISETVFPAKFRNKKTYKKKKQDERLDTDNNEQFYLTFKLLIRKKKIKKKWLKTNERIERDKKEKLMKYRIS